MSSVPNPPLKLLPQQKSRKDSSASIPQEASHKRTPKLPSHRKQKSREDPKASITQEAKIQEMADRDCRTRKHRYINSLKYK